MELWVPAARKGVRVTRIPDSPGTLLLCLSPTLPMFVFQGWWCWAPTGSIHTWQPVRGWRW